MSDLLDVEEIPKVVNLPILIQNSSVNHVSLLKKSDSLHIRLVFKTLILSIASTYKCNIQD